MRLSSALILALSLSCVPTPDLAQTSAPKPVKASDKADILFAVSPPPSEKDESGKPALASMEPVAFLVNNEIRGCYWNGSWDATGRVKADAIEAALYKRLLRAYTRDRTYPLWSSGTPWGAAVAVKSCMDKELDLEGCIQLRPQDSHTPIASTFTGIAFTGSAAPASHQPLKLAATATERASFLKTASAAFADHHVRARVSQIRTGPIWRIQLQVDRTALVGTARAIAPAAQPNTWHSYRIFLVAEQTGDTYSPVLSSFHKADVVLDTGPTPEPGADLDEESATDKEEFFDNFPLFSGEPDVIISRHSYYEDWNFSIYRRVGSVYKEIYIGCGGGA